MSVKRSIICFQRYTFCPTDMKIQLQHLHNIFLSRSHSFMNLFNKQSRSTHSIENNLKEKLCENVNCVVGDFMCVFVCFTHFSHFRNIAHFILNVLRNFFFGQK